MSSVCAPPSGYRRHSHRGSEEVMYNGIYRWYVCRLASSVGIIIYARRDAGTQNQPVGHSSRRVSPLKPPCVGGSTGRPGVARHGDPHLFASLAPQRSKDGFTAKVAEHLCRWLNVSIDYEPVSHVRAQATTERLGGWLHERSSAPFTPRSTGISFVETRTAMWRAISSHKKTQDTHLVCERRKAEICRVCGDKRAIRRPGAGERGRHRAGDGGVTTQTRPPALTRAV